MKIKISTKIILLCTGLVLITSLTLGGYSFHQQQEEILHSITEDKKSENRILANVVGSKINELRNDAYFLSSTPPIQGILRATQNKGVDPKDGSSLKQWKDRLETIFREMLHAKRNYLQIRFIGVADGGKELLRLERVRSKILRTKEADLQSKAKERYFQDIIKSRPDQVYFSKINANRENGKVTMPVQMVLRAAVPIFIQRDKPFGFVIININYNRIFNSLGDFLNDNEDYFIVNSDQEILLHSNPEYNYNEQTGSLLKISDYLSDLPKAKRDPVTGSWERSFKRNDKLYISHRLHYNPLNHSQFVDIFISLDNKSIKQLANKRIGEHIWIIIFLCLFAIISSILFSNFFSRPVSELIDFAKKIKSGDREAKLSIKSKDEIGNLASTLTEMLDDINAKDKALLNQQEALNYSAIVAETDSSGRITYSNEKFIEISGYSKEELLGSDHRILNSGHHDKEFFRNLWDTIRAGKIWHGEVLNKKKDGGYYWVDTTIYPVQNERGELEKFIAIRIDITDKKNLLIDLEKKSIQAKEALESKSSFFANMSHEIRTPLNGIVGFTDLLLNNDLDTDTREQINHIKNCTQTLHGIINDILDLSKIDAGKLELEKKPLNIEETLKSTLLIFSAEANQKGVSLDSKIGSDVPLGVIGDQLRIRQILINLIGNALKFTESGSIEVFLNYKGEQANKVKLQIDVKDSGIGIPKEKQGKLFQGFSQVDDNLNRKFGGTGLGLSICSRLVKLMGGEIWINSEEGLGSTFSFTMMVEKTADLCMLPQKKEEVLAPSIENTGTKILVAEDNKLNQALISKVLSKIGCDNFRLADNGSIAFEMAKAEVFDVILMDVQMPEMDGLEATQRIREEKSLSYRPLIIGLSANAFPEDIEKGLAVGMDHYLEKPLNINKLSTILKSIKRAS